MFSAGTSKIISMCLISDIMCKSMNQDFFLPVLSNAYAVGVRPLGKRAFKRQIIVIIVIFAMSIIIIFLFSF